MSLLVLKRITPAIYQLRAEHPALAINVVYGQSSYEKLRIAEYVRRLPVCTGVFLPVLRPREVHIVRIGNTTYFVRPWSRTEAGGQVYSLASAVTLLHTIAQRDLLGREDGLIL